MNIIFEMLAAFMKSRFFTDSIKIWQNYACIIVILFCTYDLFIAKNILYSDNVIILHMISDLFLTDRQDLRYHHYLTFLLYIACNQTYKRDQYDYYKMMYPFIATEFSTLPYAINCLIDLHQIKSLYKYKNALQIAFVSSFFYCRIYSYAKNVLWSDEYSSMIYNNQNSFAVKSINRLLVYSFFILNMYWALIIIKRTFRDLMNRLELPFRCEYSNIISSNILRWSILFQTMTSMLFYSIWYNPKATEYYLLYIAGQMYLTYNSYHFHSECRNELLKTRDVNYSEFPMNYIFILDQSAIHIHSFFAALSVGLLTKNMGYVLASAIHHSIGFGNLLKVMMNSYSMRYSENSTEKDFLQLLVGIPLAFDSLYIAGCSQNMVTIEKMAIILVLFYMNGKINVFYNYSHLSFHVLVFLQNILLCSIISKLSYE